MRDGKALQMGTSHELGQNFARAPSTSATCHRTVVASSPGRRRGARPTRMVGGLIMVHGDDAGLRVPPRLAPIQVAT